jgi:hypothetical protein
MFGISLPTIRVPTLVLHRTGDRCLHVDEGRYFASLIPHARFVELAGDDHLPFVGDQDALLDEVERFLTGARPSIDGNRVLVTILCGRSSGGPGVETGESAERFLLEAASQHAPRFGGHVIRTSNARINAVFDGPARAIRCACAICLDARRANHTVRVGLHTGECDMVAGAPQGVAVDIGSRVADVVAPGEVLVTRTVVDLVAGSGLRFVDRGIHALTKGHKGWRLYAAREGAAEPVSMVAR